MNNIDRQIKKFKKRPSNEAKTASFEGCCLCYFRLYLRVRFILILLYFLYMWYNKPRLYAKNLCDVFEQDC